MDDAALHVLNLAGLTACAMIVSFIGRWIVLRQLPNIVATIPGPPSPSWIYGTYSKDRIDDTNYAGRLGNMLQLVLAENYGEHEFQWLKRYGPLYRVRGCFGENRLVVSDPHALRHILNNPSITHPPSQSKIAHLVFGKESVFCAEGEKHRRLRAAMSGGFSGRSVRTFLPVFVDVAKKVIHEWEMLCAPDTSTQLNVGTMMHHATLDIICEAVLGFHVNTVQNPLRLGICMSSPFPAVRSFNIATEQLMGERTKGLERDEDKHCDLLSIMRVLGFSLCSSSEIKIVGDRAAASKTGVTSSQLIRQVPVLLLGQDTTDAVLSWAFYWVAKNPEFQHNLRQEILSSNLADYDSMPLLNALLKNPPFTLRFEQETLRLFPAAPLIERWANEDCVLPLSSEIVTSTGEHLRELPIRKGQFIFLAVEAYQRYLYLVLAISPALILVNRLEHLWGPDADDFKPCRWLQSGPCTGQALGPLAFLGGDRVCAGWRFALLEMQVILVELLAKFSFSLSENSVVRGHLSGIQFPVDDEGIKGLWLSVEQVVY
ncbi:cytochrome P450 [Mycena pura]|uniref:Cytochrome P450 n=1 Tax=Mycena pura TaxID=153505 RepID=A0AAD6YEN6_9AGAR|nr:cytochrome P450 [Mycena pura]